MNNDNRKNGSSPLRRSLKSTTTTVEQVRQRRFEETVARGKQRRNEKLKALRESRLQKMDNVVMGNTSHSSPMPFSMMHGAPLVPQHHTMPSTPFVFTMPQQLVLTTTHTSTAMEVELPTSHGVSTGQGLSPMLHGSVRSPSPPLKDGLGTISESAWAKFSAHSATENRRDAVGLPAAVNRPSPELSNFLYDKGGPALDHQVKYGPGANIGKQDQARLETHYGANVMPRLSQYSSNRDHYVKAARGSGRPLTHQEFDVDKGVDPGPTSINHVIASGTGQNLFNQMTLQFNEGRRNVSDGMQPGLPVHQPNVRKGLAQQAAAVGRMAGIGRAILAEEAPRGSSFDHSLGPKTSQRDPHLRKRDAMLGNIRTAFDGGTQAERLGGYKTYLKNTFDSFGNLRLGHGKGNGRVSTGIDIPLTSSLTPTPRGERLYHANLNFGLTSMETPAKVQAAGSNYRSGFFTTSQGRKLSSSTEK